MGVFAQKPTPVQITTADGVLEGMVGGDGLVRTFKGIPHATTSDFWTHFAKHGDPNGSGLPKSPPHNSKNEYPVMFLNAAPGAQPDANRARYEFVGAHASQSTEE